MRSILHTVLLCLTLSLLAACSSDARSIDAEATADVYTTRGVVRALPDPATPGSELQIRHEEIADFKSIDGEVVGMKSMTMPFPVDAAMLEGVAEGDRVSFDFEVRWEGSPPMKVTRLEVLPAETRLEFEETAEPVMEAPVEGPAETAAETADETSD